MILNKHLLVKKGEPEEYDVEKIVAERKDGHRMLYLVKWVGYPHEENTWQPRAHLKNAPEKIREWNLLKKSKNNRLSASQLLQPEPQQRYIKNTKHLAKKQAKTTKKTKEIALRTSTVSNHKDLPRHPSEAKREASDQTEKNGGISLNLRQGVCLRSRKSLSIKEVTKKELQLSRSTQSDNYSKIQKSINLQLQNPAKEQASFQKKDQTEMYSNYKQTLQENPDYFIKKQSLKHQYDDVFIVEQSISQSQRLQRHQAYEQYDHSIQIFFQMDKNESLQCHNSYLKKEVSENEAKRLHDKSSNFIDVNLYEKNERFVIQCQNEEDDAGQSAEQVQCLLHLRSSHNHFFQESPQQGPIIVNEPEYSMLAYITKLFKEQGVVYCSVLTKIGQEIDKLPYQTVEAERPDLVCSFFNGKYPCTLSFR